MNNETETESVVFGGQSIVSLKNGSRIARGSFGVVDVGLFRHANGSLHLAALKTISQAFKDPSRKKLNDDVAHEVKALKLLNGNKNIVGLLAVFDRSNPPALVLGLEYCPVDLQTTIEWRRRSCYSLLSVDVVKMIAHDIALGLAHCHIQGVVHRDIRPANLLVSSSGHIKLCDFGLALPIGTSLSRPEGNGLCALQYRSPEALLGGAGDHPPSDVFAAGLVIAELLSGKILLSGRNVIDQLQRMFSLLGSPGATQWFNKLPDFHTFRFEECNPKAIEIFLPRVSESPNLSKFLQQCLSIEPGARPSSGAELLRDQWFERCTTDHWRIAEQTIPPNVDELFMVPTSCEERLISTLARKQAKMKQQLVQSLL